MDMKTYLRQASPEQREELASAVSSSVAYLYQIGGLHKKPSAKLCQMLVGAEPKLSLAELRPDIWAVTSSTTPASTTLTTDKLAVGEGV